MKVDKKALLKLFTFLALLTLCLESASAATTTTTKNDILNFLKSDKTEKLQRTDSFTDKDFAYLLQDNAATAGITCKVFYVTYSDGAKQYFNDFSTNDGSLIVSCRGTFEKTGVDKKADSPEVGKTLSIYDLWRTDNFNYGHRSNGELSTVEKITYLDREGKASSSLISTCSTCPKSKTSCTECSECKQACGNNTTCLATCNSVCSTCPTASTKSDSCTTCQSCKTACNGDADCIAKCKESSDCKSCTSSSSTSTKTIGSCSASDNAKIEEVIKEYYNLDNSKRTPCKLRSIMKNVFGE